VLMSLMLYLNRTSRPLVLDVKPDPAEGSYHYSTDTGLPDCPQLKMLRINGSIFFGAIDHIQGKLEEVDERNHRQKHLLIVASGMNFIDMPGAEMLLQESRRRRMLGGGLYFYRVKNEVLNLLEQGGYLTGLGKANFFPVKTRPVSYIYPKLDPEICRRCKAKIFKECLEQLPNGEPLPVPAPPKTDEADPAMAGAQLGQST
jgi:SulP family sulfate permease